MCRLFFGVHVLSLFCELGIGAVTIVQAVSTWDSHEHEENQQIAVFLACSLLATVLSFAISLVGFSAVSRMLWGAVRAGAIAVRRTSRASSKASACANTSERVPPAADSDTEELAPHGSLLSFVRGFPQLVHQVHMQSTSMRSNRYGSRIAPVLSSRDDLVCAQDERAHEANLRGEEIALPKHGLAL